MVKLDLRWEAFDYQNHNQAVDFESMCRRLFEAKYVRKGENIHTNHNLPGIEVLPVLERDRGDGLFPRRISFQAKYYGSTSGAYSAFQESAEKVVEHFKGKLDAVYLFSNQTLTTTSIPYQKIVDILKKANIDAIPVSNQDLLDLVAQYPEIANAYFPTLSDTKPSPVDARKTMHTNIKRQVTDMVEFGNQYTPKVFISYSWKSEEYKDRVLKIATRLREDGVDVILDQWHLRPGQDMYYFMENSIRISDRVLVLCEDSYTKKADSREDGVGTETIITAPEVYKNPNQEKFIPVIMEKPVSLPTYMKGRLAVDYSDDVGYKKILYAAYGISIGEVPSVGDPPEDIINSMSGKNMTHVGAEKKSSAGQAAPRSISENEPVLGQTSKLVQQALDKGSSQQKPEQQKKSESDPQRKKPYSGTVGVGEIINFGRYPFGKDGEIENLKWRVLEVEKDRALIITNQLIDCVPYNRTRKSVTWETCSLRKWMNEVFFVEAFNEDERSSIIQITNRNSDNMFYNTKGGEDTSDRVFALSIDKANEYFNNVKDRMAAVTPYADKQGSYISEKYKVDGRPTGWWWLRSPGNFSSYAAHVGSDGGVYVRGLYVGNSGGSVRPALWLNL